MTRSIRSGAVHIASSAIASTRSGAGTFGSAATSSTLRADCSSAEQEIRHQRPPVGRVQHGGVAGVGEGLELELRQAGEPGGGGDRRPVRGRFVEGGPEQFESHAGRHAGLGGPVEHPRERRRGAPPQAPRPPPGATDRSGRRPPRRCARVGRRTSPPGTTPVPPPSSCPPGPPSPRGTGPGRRPVRRSPPAARPRRRGSEPPFRPAPAPPPARRGRHPPSRAAANRAAYSRGAVSPSSRIAHHRRIGSPSVARAASGAGSAACFRTQTP